MAPHAVKHRLYFALRPDAAAARAATWLTAAACGRHGLAAPPMSAKRLHVSLNFLHRGDTCPDPRLATRALAAVRAIEVRPFRVAFNRLVSWKRTDPQSRPLVLVGDEGVIGVDWLRGEIEGVLAEAGLVQADGRERWTHMTVLWGAHQVDERLREPIAWTVGDVVLLDSVAGEGRQVTLGCVPLTPAPPPALRAWRPGPRRSAAR